MLGRRAGVVGLLCAALAAGCGGGSDKGLTSGQRSGLIAQLEAVRASAAAGNVNGTTTAIRRFRVSVARLERAGALTAAQAHALRLGAMRVLARVRNDHPAPQPQPTPTPAPAPAPPAHHPPGHEKKPKDKKHGPHGKDKKH